MTDAEGKMDFDAAKWLGRWLRLLVGQVIQPAFANDVGGDLISRLLMEADNAISSRRFDDAAKKMPSGVESAWRRLR
ncbi:hypothetical protein ABT364_05710 [Massilia sp. SR12]